ncbi:MAG: DUF992 domain-containing protein [Mariprofundaceae bacterium]
MKMKHMLSYALGLVLTVLVAFPVQQALAAAESSAGTKIGILTCKTVEDSGFTLIVHSTADITCKFESTAGGGAEYYKGETGVGLGVDLRWDRKTTLVYTVFAADFKKGTYQMAGKYYGAGGSATVGVGAGAQGLVGGNNKSVSLEPMVSGSTGAGVSGGLTYLYLEPDRSR